MARIAEPSNKEFKYVNLSTADRVVLRCMAELNVLQNASHLVKSPLNLLGSSLGSFTLEVLASTTRGWVTGVTMVPVTTVSLVSGAAVTVWLVPSCVVVLTPASMLLTVGAVLVEGATVGGTGV